MVYSPSQEELPENEQVRGSYSGAAGYSQAIDLKVTNPKGEAVLEAFGKDSVCSPATRQWVGLGDT